MTDDERADDRTERLLRVRRAPPPFEEVHVVASVALTPRMRRLTLAGDVVRRLDDPAPAASIRLVVPWPGEALELPEWNGNEFLLADGRRPALRTFTPLRLDRAAGSLDVEVVRHPGGAVAGWAEAAVPGDLAAISGPGSGYSYPDGATGLLVLGDETALPAIGQVIAGAPAHLRLDVHVEVVARSSVIDLALPADSPPEWHVTPAGAVPGGELVSVVRALDSLPDGVHVWAAGEASAMQAIRTHLFTTLGVPRRRATVRGYWKPAPGRPEGAT